MIRDPGEEGPGRRPILFAHRGASALAAENTLEAFRLAIELGATGLESDVHLDADGTPVLVHDAVAETAYGAIVIRATRAALLRRLGIPTLADLYAACGTGWPISLDVNDARAVETARAVIATARTYGEQAVRGLLLCHEDPEVLATIAADRSGAVLVLSTDRASIGILDGSARRSWLTAMRGRGIGVLNLHREDWEADGAAAAIASVHEAGMQAFAWDTQREDQARAMLTAGADGVYADDPAVLVAAARSLRGERPAGG